MWGDKEDSCGACLLELLQKTIHIHFSTCRSGEEKDDPSAGATGRHQLQVLARARTPAVVQTFRGFVTISKAVLLVGVGAASH